MLLVTVEVVPGGFSPLRRTVASLRIANISELADCSDYLVQAMEAANPLTGTAPYNAQCVVAGHDRRQSVWMLLERACREIARADPVEM